MARSCGGLASVQWGNDNGRPRATNVHAAGVLSHRACDEPRLRQGARARHESRTRVSAELDSNHHASWGGRMRELEAEARTGMRSKSILMCTRARESWVMSMWLLWHSTSHPSRRMREPPNGVTIRTSATWPWSENGRGAPRSLAASSSDESCIMAGRWLAAHKSAMSITEGSEGAEIFSASAPKNVDENGNFNDISDPPDCILHRLFASAAGRASECYSVQRRQAARTADQGTKSGPVHRLTARQSRLTCVRRATGRSALSYTHQQQQCNRRHSRVEVQWDTRTRPSSASAIVRDCEPWHTASHSSRAHPPNTHRSRRGSSSTPSGTHLHTHLYIPYGRSRMAESTTPYRAALQIVSIARRETNLARHAPLPLSLPRHRQGCARPDQ